MNSVKRVKLFVVIISITVTACLTMAVWFKQSYPVEAKVETAGKLTLQVSTSKSKYLKFEPIQIRFDLINQTGFPVTWNGNLVLGENINLLTRPENGAEVRTKMGNRAVDTPIVKTETTQPNGSKTKLNLINGNLAEQLFPLPGRYQLRVEFSYIDLSFSEPQNVTTVSDPITVEIGEPLGNDLLAYNFLKQIFTPVVTTGKVDEILQKRKIFVDTFTDNVYWKYMTFELANTYLTLNRNVEAENEYYKISDIDFYYTAQVQSALLKLSDKLGRPVPRLKRMPSIGTPPTAVTIPNPVVPTGPMPNNPPVVIPIPNPVVNSTPVASPTVSSIGTAANP